MRLFRIFAIFFFVLISGCAYPGIRLVSNIPWNSTVVTVVNNTNYSLDLIQEGKTLVSEMSPGSTAAVGMWNLSGSYAQSSLVVLAKEPKSGKFIGSASKTSFISGYNRQSEVWTITCYEIKPAENCLPKAWDPGETVPNYLFPKQ